MNYYTFFIIVLCSHSLLLSAMDEPLNPTLLSLLGSNVPEENRSYIGSLARKVGKLTGTISMSANLAGAGEKSEAEKTVKVIKDITSCNTDRPLDDILIKQFLDRCTATASFIIYSLQDLRRIKQKTAISRNDQHHIEDVRLTFEKLKRTHGEEGSLIVSKQLLNAFEKELKETEARLSNDNLQWPSSAGSVSSSSNSAQQYRSHRH